MERERERERERKRERERERDVETFFFFTCSLPLFFLLPHHLFPPPAPQKATRSTPQQPIKVSPGGLARKGKKGSGKTGNDREKGDIFFLFFFRNSRNSEKKMEAERERVSQKTRACSDSAAWILLVHYAFEAGAAAAVVEREREREWVGQWREWVGLKKRIHAFSSKHRLRIKKTYPERKRGRGRERGGGGFALVVLLGRGGGGGF